MAVSPLATSRPTARPWTADALLAWERTQDERYEYVDGMSRARTGGTIDHRQIISNLHAGLRARLAGGGHRVFVDTPKVDAGTAVTYPDLVVTFVPQRPTADVIDQPVMIVDVLSKATAAFDRGAKLKAYVQIDSLRHYVIVSQLERLVEVYSRPQTNGKWTFESLTAGARDGPMSPEPVVALSAIGVGLGFAEIYEDTSLA